MKVISEINRDREFYSLDRDIATNVADFDMIIKSKEGGEKEINLDVKKLFIQNEGTIDQNYNFFRVHRGFAVGCKSVNALEKGEL